MCDVLCADTLPACRDSRRCVSGGLWGRLRVQRTDTGQEEQFCSAGPGSHLLEYGVSVVSSHGPFYLKGPVLVSYGCCDKSLQTQKSPVSSSGLKSSYWQGWSFLEALGQHLFSCLSQLPQGALRVGLGLPLHPPRASLRPLLRLRHCLPVASVPPLSLLSGPCGSFGTPEGQRWITFGGLSSARHTHSLRQPVDGLYCHPRAVTIPLSENTGYGSTMLTECSPVR